ncbi:MAG: hypothetical protein K0Q65_2058 [Clostridia bacterium]|nr:hypothetical protein [Clostridia bacterium]
MKLDAASAMRFQADRNTNKILRLPQMTANVLHKVHVILNVVKNLFYLST